MILKNLSHSDIARKLITLVGFLTEFDPSLTVGILTDKLKDYTIEWLKIKNVIDDDTDKSYSGIMIICR